LIAYRIQSLLSGEKRWLSNLLDSKLGLSLGSSLNFSNLASEALTHNVIVCLGLESRNILIGNGNSVTPIEDFAGKIVITTGDVKEAINSPLEMRRLLVDFLKARIYEFGLGNSSSGFIERVRLAGATGELEFSAEQFESFLNSFENAMEI
jgi:hypothetical protein